jgi:hypothetical protein
MAWLQEEGDCSFESKGSRGLPRKMCVAIIVQGRCTSSESL